MSIFDQYFGKQPNKITDYTIPQNLTAREFGKIYVRKTTQKTKVLFTILMPPQGQNAEGWQTGIALDASSSMTSSYGRELQGELPTKVIESYAKKNWITNEEEDGLCFRIFEKAAVKDALTKGYFKYSKNIVEPLARQFIAYLASNLDVNGKTTVIYWAGGNGSQYEEIGAIHADECENLTIQGPQKIRFGLSTKLRPAMQYYCNHFPNAERSMYIFITDGYIDDLEEVKHYTTKLAKNIATNTNKLVKCILIGVGDEIDSKQMLDSDNLNTDTNQDIWDYKIAANLRNLVEVFAELVDENQIVAPLASIYDSNGQLVKKFTDGLPAKVQVDFPVNTKQFELEIMEQRIKQTLDVS